MICDIAFLTFIGNFTMVDMCLHTPDSLPIVILDKRYISHLEIPVIEKHDAQSVVVTVKGRVIYSIAAEELDGIKYFTKLKDFKEAEIAVVYRKKF